MKKLKFLIFISCLVIFCISGCRSQKAAYEENNKKTESDEKDFEGLEFTQRKDDISGIIGFAKCFSRRKNKTFFFTVTRKSNLQDNNMIHEYRIYEMDHMNSPCEIAFYSQENKRIDKILPTDKGGLYVLIYDEDEKTFAIQELEKGRLKDISSELNQRELQSVIASSGFLVDLYAYDKGFIAISENSVKYYDLLFNMVREENISGEVIDTCMPNDNYLFFLTKDVDEKYYVNRIETGNGKQDRCILKHKNMKCISEAYSEYDVYVIGEQGICGLKYDDKEETPLCNMNGTYIGPNEIFDVYMISDETFIIPETVDDTNGVLRIYAKTNDDKSKKTLTLMGTYCNPEIRNAVKNFNNSHNTVNIIIKDFETYVNPEQQMTLEINAGNTPDMYILDMNGVGNWDLETCVEKGMFENLVQYVENDPVIDEKDFNPYVYNTMFIGDGLYFSGGYVDIHTVVIPDKVSYNITFDEFFDYTNNLNSNAVIFPKDDKCEILHIFMNGYMDDFVNLKEKKIYFESDGFKDLLILCNREAVFSENEDPGYTNLFRNREIVGMEISNNIPEIQIAEELYGNKLCNIGFPTKGALASFQGSIAMSPTCNDKELAWEFMRFFMTSEYIKNNYYISSNNMIPIRNDGLEAYIELFDHSEVYIDRFGIEISNSPIGSGIGEYDVGISIHILRDREKEYFYDTIESINGIYGCNQDVYSIIEDEAQDYFNGKKELEDVVTIIQNRVQTYIDEMD